MAGLVEGSAAQRLKAYQGPSDTARLKARPDTNQRPKLKDPTKASKPNLSTSRMLSLRVKICCSVSLRRLCG